MRQELEAVVHQLKTESADAGENQSRCRFPAGFCPLTCLVHKWKDIFDTVLRGYPHGSPKDPQYGDYYSQWEEEPQAFARDAAMKKAFHEVAW